MVAMFIKDTGLEGWDQYLPHVTFAHNSSRQDTTEETPYFLMFGRQAILPMDLSFARASPSLLQEHPNKRMREAFDLVRTNLEKRQERNRVDYDSSKREDLLAIGELVTYQVPIRKKGVPDKFQPKVRGPYRVIKVLSNLAYVIKPTGSIQIQIVPVESRTWVINMITHITEKLYHTALILTNNVHSLIGALS